MEARQGAPTRGGSIVRAMPRYRNNKPFRQARQRRPQEPWQPGEA